MKIDLKHPANRNPPLGCDSATGGGGADISTVREIEIVVVILKICYILKIIVSVRVWVKVSVVRTISLS